VRAADAIPHDARAPVEQAIRDAEDKAAAEIVVALATRSGRYDRAEDLFGVAFAIFLVVLVSVSVPASTGSGSWGSPFDVSIHLGLVVLLFAGGFTLGAWLAARFPVLARAFIPRAHMEAEVRRRGVEAFHHCSVSETKSGRGVLIFASLYERMVWISGDDAISAHIDDEHWGPVRDAVIAGFKRRDPASGLTEAVRLAGDLLARHLPPRDLDVNELPNALHVFD